MARTNLKASTAYEEAIYKYIEENASDVLVNIINASKKTLGGCMNFIKGEAKKEAKNGVAMIEDKTVFGWAVHYFEEDSIKEGQKAEFTGRIVHTDTPPKKKEEKKIEPKSAQNEVPQLAGQMDIFDFLK